MVSFEVIRFPVIFGSFLFAASTAYIFREHLIPNLEEEKRQIFRGSEEDRQIIKDAIKSMK